MNLEEIIDSIRTANYQAEGQRLLVDVDDLYKLVNHIDRLECEANRLENSLIIMENRILTALAQPRQKLRELGSYLNIKG